MRAALNGLREKRAELQAQLEQTLLVQPENAVERERLIRLLAWNRREVEMAKRRKT